MHVTALQNAVLAAFTTDKPCHRKARRPPTPAALVEAEHLRSSTSGPPGVRRHDDEVVVDLRRWAQAAQSRKVAP